MLSGLVHAYPLSLAASPTRVVSLLQLLNPTWLHHYHSESMVYIRVHSSCLFFLIQKLFHKYLLNTFWEWGLLCWVLRKCNELVIGGKKSPVSLPTIQVFLWCIKFLIYKHFSLLVIIHISLVFSNVLSIWQIIKILCVPEQFKVPWAKVGS